MTNETAEPMAMDAAALERETRQILSDYPHTRVEQSAGGWLIGLGWAGIEHVGHTGIDPNTSNDPRDMARRLMAIALSAIDSSGEDERRLAPVEDEDLGAEMLAAEVEAEGGGEPVPGESTDDAGPGEQDQVAGAVDHGGVLIHYDQVEIARAQIAMKVSDHEEILVGALSSRWPDLTAAFRDTNNLSPHLWSDQQGADRMEFMRLSQIESSIRGHAVNLRRAVKDADADQLRNIDAHLAEGWPT